METEGVLLLLSASQSHPSIATTTLLSMRVSACLVVIRIMGYLLSTGRKRTLEVWEDLNGPP